MLEEPGGKQVDDTMKCEMKLKRQKLNGVKKMETLVFGEKNADQIEMYKTRKSNMEPSKYKEKEEELVKLEEDRPNSAIENGGVKMAEPKQKQKGSGNS